MNNIKEGAAVSAGLTAPAWMPIFNEWVGCLIGVATLFYICAKAYVLLSKMEDRDDQF